VGRWGSTTRPVTRAPLSPPPPRPRCPAIRRTRHGDTGSWMGPTAPCWVGTFRQARERDTSDGYDTLQPQEDLKVAYDDPCRRMSVFKSFLTCYSTPADPAPATPAQHTHHKDSVSWPIWHKVDLLPIHTSAKVTPRRTGLSHPPPLALSPLLPPHGIPNSIPVPL
jgi:hypothetical protein